MHNSAHRSSVDIAIIGGGASGTLTAINLLEKWRSTPGVPPLRLTLVDAQARLGRGVAYGTDCALHLLNVPAKGMSAYPEKPDHFSQWLASVQAGARPETFARRSLYGEYLQHQLAAAGLRPSPATSLTTVQSKATSVARENDIYVVRLESGEQIKCDAVVLALGNFPPQFGSYADNEWFHNNPWDSRLSQQIKPEDTVLLIGTGLTMIDVALVLSCNGHQGQLHAVSRHGYVPQPHFSYDNLAAELPTSYLNSALPITARALFQELRSAVRTAELEAPGRWRCVMNELRLRGHVIWQSFALVEKKRFLRHLRQLWEVHRHRMAPEITASLALLQFADVLTVTAARVISMEAEGDRVLVELKRRGSDEIIQVQVDHVINCTGPDTDYRTTTDPLLRSLFDHELAEPDALGLGVLVSNDGALISADGVVQENVYTVGSLRKGTLWESTAIPELRDQAHQVAESLVQRFSDTGALAARSADVHVRPDAR